MHHAEKAKPVGLRLQPHFLTALANCRLGHRLTRLDVTRNDTELAVLVPGVEAAEEQNVVTFQEKNVHGNGEPCRQVPSSREGQKR